MRPYIEQECFDNQPLNSLRNLPTEHYSEDYPAYVFEDPNSFIPAYVVPERRTDFTYQLDNPSVQKLVEIKRIVGMGDETLPIANSKEQIVDLVRNNQVVIISAELGAGKSTQVPPYLLEDGWNRVFLTQPRRAAARNVFHRITDVVKDAWGEEKSRELVGFRTAEEHEGPEDARLQVITDGLQQVREFKKNGIREGDVIIVDEAHEGLANVDVLLAWYKIEIAKNPNLRLVLMSGTMDTNHYADYFADVCQQRPPIVEVPGRTHNVDWKEKPESNVVKEAIIAAQTLAKEQASLAPRNGVPNGIAVAVKGVQTIEDTIDAIRSGLPPEVAKVAKFFPLHAKLSPAEQQAAINHYSGVKIIVTTDVAKTSLTIPDLKYVIDSGWHNQIELDHKGIRGLVPRPSSQADCDQWAGRVGRVSDGFYILTRQDDATPHISYSERSQYPVPEILRTDLARNVLRFASVDLDMAMVDLPHPVVPEDIERAQEHLRTLGALDKHNYITTIGMHMDEFPVGVASARMLVEARRYNELTRAYMSVIAAANEVGGLPYFAYGVGKEWKKLTEETSSDLLAQLDIFIAVQDMPDGDPQLKTYDLDSRNVEHARKQYRKIAKRLHALQETLPPPTVQEREDLKQCIYAGMINSVFKANGSGTYVHIGDPDEPRKLSNRSVVQGKPEVVFGDRYRIVTMKAGELLVEHIIEHVTTATLAELGKVAVDLTTWKSDGFAMRNGRFVEVRRQQLLGDDTGVVKEIAAESSPKLREAIIEHAMNNAGPAQKALRKIKSDLEILARLAKDPIPQLTHDQIVQLVRAATPADITDPSLIDSNLRGIIRDKGITLEAFVPVERQERIYMNAPSTFAVKDTGIKLNISYQGRRPPEVRNYDLQAISDLAEEVFLPDGRHVYFVHEGKRCSLFELQAKLEIGALV